MVDHLVEGVSQPQLVVDNTEVAFQEIAKWHRKNFDGTVIGVGRELWQNINQGNAGYDFTRFFEHNRKFE